MKTIFIITSGRSGSTMLLNALTSHSQIRDYKAVEPLAESSRHYSYYHDFIRREFNEEPDEYKLYNKGITDTYKKIACKKYLSHVVENEDVIKLLYGHIETDEIINFLKECDCNIIHLVRKNMTSRTLSAFYNRWSSEEFNKNYEDVTKEKFIQNFYHIIVKEHCIDALFNKKIFKVFYEDLLEDWDYWIRILQEKCNLPYERIVKPENPYNRPSFSDFFSNFEIPKKIEKRYPKEIWEKE